VVATAKINDDSMKNTGFMTGKVLVSFDDLKAIHLDSPEYEFIKQITQNASHLHRDLYQSAREMDATAWFWFNGNPTNDRTSPIPFTGDSADGVDRRFSSYIVLYTLVEVVMKHRPDFTKDQAIRYVADMWDKLRANLELTQIWLGNLIMDSGVLYKSIDDYPRAWHGDDYKSLCQEQDEEIESIVRAIFGICTDTDVNSPPATTYMKVVVLKKIYQLLKNWNSTNAKVLQDKILNVISPYGYEIRQVNLKSGGTGKFYIHESEFTIPGKSNIDTKGLEYMEKHKWLGENEWGKEVLNFKEDFE